MTARKTPILAALLAVVVAVPVAHAQVGKSQGVVDANTAPEADLAKMPHMTPAIAKSRLRLPEAPCEVSVEGTNTLTVTPGRCSFPESVRWGTGRSG